MKAYKGEGGGGQKSIDIECTYFLNGPLSEILDDALLCTVNIVGLYPDIPHGDGLKMVRQNTRQNLSISRVSS